MPPAAMSVLDPTSGKVLRTVPIEGAPNAAVADERAGHVVAPVLAGPAVRPQEW